MKFQGEKFSVLLLAAAIAQNAHAIATGNDDNATTTQGVPVTINVLQNDTSSFTQPVFTISPQASPANGSVVFNSDNTVTYTPNPGFTGTDSFDYYVDDGSGYGGSAMVYVTVDAAPANNMLTPQQARVDAALTNACASAPSGSALAATCGTYQGLNADDQVAAINQILPQQLPMQMQGVMLQQNQIFHNLRDRLQSLRAGARGFSLSGLSLNLGGDNALPLGQMLQSGLASSAGSAGDGGDPFADTPWSAFVSGRINNGKIDERTSQPGLDYRTDTVTFGADYRASSAFIIGGALGYSDTSSDVGRDRGDIDLKSVNLSVYGNYYPIDNLYIDWVAGFSRNDYDGSRAIRFGDIDTATRFDSDGKQYSLGFTVGYDMNIRAIQLGGYVRTDYIHAQIDAYRESGGAGLALLVGDRNERSLETAVGGRVGYTIPFSKGVLIPAFDAEYVHQWRDDPRTITVALAEAPDSGSFSVDTLPLDSDYYNIGVSFTGVFTAGRSAFLRYQTMIGREDVRDNSIEAGFRFEF